MIIWKLKLWKMCVGLYGFELVQNKTYNVFSKIITILKNGCFNKINGVEKEWLARLIWLLWTMNKLKKKKHVCISFTHWSVSVTPLVFCGSPEWHLWLDPDIHRTQCSLAIFVFVYNVPMLFYQGISDLAVDTYDNSLFC